MNIPREMVMTILWSWIIWHILYMSVNIIMGANPFIPWEMVVAVRVQSRKVYFGERKSWYYIRLKKSQNAFQWACDTCIHWSEIYASTAYKYFIIQLLPDANVCFETRRYYASMPLANEKKNDGEGITSDWWVASLCCVAISLHYICNLPIKLTYKCEYLTTFMEINFAI